jgi:hypothetical protein
MRDKDSLLDVYARLSKAMNEVLDQYRAHYELTPTEILPWLMSTISGQFAMTNYSERFVSSSLDRVFEDYIKKRREKETCASG